MARVKKFLILCLVIFLIFVVVGAFVSKNPAPTQVVPTPQPETRRTSAKVTRVIDGDTIEVEGGRRVRLIGIDTPELTKSSTTGCFGREAYDYARAMLTGQIVSLEKDVSEVDRYNRLLRYIYLGETFVNDKLVRDGYARVYTYPPDVKYKDRFLESERYARENNLGLWSKCR